MTRETQTDSNYRSDNFAQTFLRHDNNISCYNFYSRTKNFKFAHVHCTHLQVVQATHKSKLAKECNFPDPKLLLLFTFLFFNIFFFQFVFSQNIPSLIWGTYYGSSGRDAAYAVETDNLGNIYITGITSSDSNMATFGAFKDTLSGSSDCFLAKFNSFGVLQWGTYFGGNGSEVPYDLAIENNGNIIITGYTNSDSSIATIGAYQYGYGGGFDCFIAKFNSTGIPIWCTYYGGSGQDRGMCITIDSSNNIIIAGVTYGSIDSIASPGAHQTTYGNGACDAFIVKFNDMGNRIWGTYYGGGGYEEGCSIATDNFGNIYCVGWSNSTDSIATSGSHQPIYAGNRDAFLVKFNSSGVRLWCTYYGGDGNESIWREGSLTVDNNNNIIIAGATESQNGISTFGSHQQFYSDSFDDFIVKFNSSGIRLWGTYYGGNGFEEGGGLDCDIDNNIYLGGLTTSPNNISTTGSYAEVQFGSCDAFVVKFNTNGIRQWGTYYGGSENDTVFTLTTDNCGNVYISGPTYSTNNIATINAHQNNFGGGFGDAYISKFGSLASFQSFSICNGDSIFISGTWQNSSGNYYDTLASVNGCDSVITSTLNILPNTSLNQSFSICRGDSIFIGGNWQKASGTYFDTLTADNSCDSVIASLLTIEQPTNFTLIQTACGSYSLNSQTYTASGTYTQSITNSVGCDSTITLFININPLPIANAGEDVTISQGSYIQLEASGGINYLWNTSENTSTITVLPERTTVYFVSVTDNNNCNDIDSITVFVDESYHIFIPSIFSPNGDSNNDYLFVRGKGIKHFVFKIYDRWGEKVFESNNLSKGWDGSFRGKPMNSAVFVYYATGEFVNGNPINQKGNITLVR